MLERNRMSRGRALVGAALAVIGTSALTVSYAYKSSAVSIATQFRVSDFLLKSTVPATGAPPPSRAVIERAIEADPLNQSIFNTAMMQIGRRESNALPADAWFTTLEHYGWRSTPALQNLIYYHASRNNIGRVLDVADALFRREKRTEEATTVFSLAETVPDLRADVIRRLQARPAWRRPFLLGSNVLTDPAAIEGRYQTLRALQRTGDRLPEQEMTALLPVLVRVGRTADAFSLWSFGRKGIARPVNDPQFSDAATVINQDDTAKPFNWRLLSGDNFDVTTRGRGAPGIVIHWNGQGVPVFATQQTSGAAGFYKMRVAFDSEDAASAKAVGYRLMCGDARIDLVYVSAPDTTHSDWRTVKPVPCAFPRLEIFGVLADARQDITFTLNDIALQRILG